MKSEFYVVNLVKSSEEACRRVAECLGFDTSLKPENVLYELSRHNVLWRFMTRFECNWRDVFEEIRRMLDRELEDTGVLEESDLDLLTDSKGQRILGELLECAPRESLQLLFSSEELQRLIRETGVARRRDPLPDNSEWLLSVLLADSARPKLEQSLGVVDRWALLYDLVHSPARQKLAGRLGCSEEEALRGLVRRIKQTDRPMKPVGSAAEFGSGPGLDAVALSKFRMYLHLYRYSLVEEAKSQAHRAKARLPGCRLPSILPSAIEYYVSRDFRSAMNDLLNSKEALRSICISEEISQIGEAHGEALIEVIAQLREASELAATVWCIEVHNGKRTEVLRLRHLDQVRLNHIQAHLPKKVAELPHTNSTIAERLQSVMLPPVSEWKRTLRAALASRTDPASLDDSFIQSLVLAGVSLRSHGLELDFGQPPDVPPRPGARVEFPAGPSAIADKLIDAYQRRGKTLKSIRTASRETAGSG